MTTETVQTIEEIRSHLKEGEQRNIFDFIYAYSYTPLGSDNGFNKNLLHYQSFRGETTMIKFKNGHSGYRMELNDRSSKTVRKPTVVFYFLDNGSTYFRLQRPTSEGKVDINEDGFDTIPGIPATNDHEKDMNTLYDALQIDPNVLFATSNPELVKGKRLVVSAHYSPTRLVTGAMTFALNRGNKNKVIHGKVRFFK